MTQTATPDYDSPPVVEVILGVQFECIEKLNAPELGLFWSNVRDDWPTADEAPYLDSTFERFGSGRPWNELKFELKKGNPPTRFQFRNDSTDWMMQVQNSRLHINWIGYGDAPTTKYPRYPIVRERFETVWDQFAAFIASEKLGPISPNQWEVSYINHIPINTVWESPADWGFLRLLSDGLPLSQAASLESFQGVWRFALPNQAGRLHVSWKTATRRNPDQVNTDQEIIVFEQTARGPLPPKSDVATIMRGLDTGRDAIVNAFVRLMSEHANNYWGLRP